MAPLRSVFGPIRRWLSNVKPEGEHLKRDAVAGIPVAISNVPDGMAGSLLAGVNPVHGLYACFAGPIAGGLTSSTRLMVVATTSAAALAAGSALQRVPAADRTDAVILLTLLAGAALILAGILKLGRYTRFVSHSVMLGFLTGISINIICGQIPVLTGAPSVGSVNLVKAIHVITHPSGIELASLFVGLAAIAILVLLSRTRLAVVGALIALIIPTAAVIAFGLDNVATVNDIGSIPHGIPVPSLPSLGVFSFSLVTGALAVAVIVMVQGAGVAESAPNAGGAAADANRDFIAQGAGNLASGLFGGQPVGGSVGETALNVTAGARSRWAAICAGLWMLLILAVFSSAVGKVAMPTLGAVLIYAGFRALRPAEIMTILRTGPNSQIAFATTFISTLFLPVAAAVGIGVALSLLLQLNQEAMDLAVVELCKNDDGEIYERRPPAVLTSHTVTVLDVYGSLFYAGSRTLQAHLPDPTGTEGAAVVLRLRGRTSLGSTFFKVIDGYAGRLDATGGRLYLSGLDKALVTQLRRSGRVPVTGPVRLYEATPFRGESTRAAELDAETFAVGRHPEP